MLSEEAVRKLRDSFWAQSEYFEEQWERTQDSRHYRLVEHYATITGILDVILEEDD